MKYAILLLFLITTTSFTDKVKELKTSEFVPKQIELEVEIKIEPKVEPEFQNWSINSIPQNKWRDVDWLAKVIMSEVADSTDTESIYLVGAVVLNHTRINQMGVIKSILKKGSFSGVNRKGYIWWEAEPTSVHKKIAIQLLTEGVELEVANVFAFCDDYTLKNPKNKAIKDWFFSHPVYKKIGEVTFFNLKENSKFAYKSKALIET
jgi:hypothetical protein